PMPMKIPILTCCLSPAIAFAITASGEDSKSAPRVIDLKAPDGTILKASYFAAAKPGPGVLLFHQSNRTRKSWEDIARQLVAVGINVLTVDPACATAAAMEHSEGGRPNPILSRKRQPVF